MVSAYRSAGEARCVFDEYTGVEPRLAALWSLCEQASPPDFELAALDEAADDDGSTYGDDPFEADTVADETHHDDWCAEDYFHLHVKSKLLLLAGSHRTAEPAHLQSYKAYDELYDILINWALARPCVCCSAGDATIGSLADDASDEGARA